jgi:hypothetical protein
MILYKYRSLANFEHILDIILNQRLHCSTYPELNDPFEGLFVTTRNITGTDFKINEAKDLFEDAIDKIKICSLSSDLNDVRLWSYYADGHKGVVFEIDFSGLETVYEVMYSEKLPSSGWWDWGIMMGAKPSIYEVLSRKTEHWAFESEYRIIDESKNLERDKYFGIKDRIKAIYLGTRTSDKYRELLKKLVQGKIPIWTTKINNQKVIVEPDKLVEE